MKNGIYEVVNFIHIYSCEYGQLKIPVGMRIEIYGDRAITSDFVRFPAKMLNTVQDSLKKID